MTWYEDMSPCWYFDKEDREQAEHFISVGWLGKGHPYNEGVVDQAIIDKLFLLLEAPWNPAMYRGIHTCTSATTS